jgi:hypothetical protein
MRHAPDNKEFTPAVDQSIACSDLADNRYDADANVVADSVGTEEAAAHRKAERGWDPAWGKAKVATAAPSANDWTKTDKAYTAAVAHETAVKRAWKASGKAEITPELSGHRTLRADHSNVGDAAPAGSATYATRGTLCYSRDGLTGMKWHDPIDRELSKAGLLCLTRRAIAEVICSAPKEAIEALSPAAQAKLKCQMADLIAPPDGDANGKRLRMAMMRTAYASDDQETIDCARSLLSPIERFRWDCLQENILADEKMIPTKNTTPEEKKALKNRRDNLRRKAKAETAKLAGKPTPDALAQQKRRAKTLPAKAAAE